MPSTTSPQPNPLLLRSPNAIMMPPDMQPHPYPPQAQQYQRPATPPAVHYADFVNPQHTPQGSPSKSHAPPGACYDLPTAFDASLRLGPAPTPLLPPPSFPLSSSTAAPATAVTMAQAQAQAAPTAAAIAPAMASGISHATAGADRKENTPPSVATGNVSPGRGAALQPSSPKKDAFMTQAAASRAEPYRAPPVAPPASGALTGGRPAYVQRGMSQDDVEKLQKPAVRRLANVTQLCKWPRSTISFD
jgi:cell cycle protein kinase DBF2